MNSNYWMTWNEKSWKLDILGLWCKTGSLPFLYNRFWRGFWTVPILAARMGVGVVLWWWLQCALMPPSEQNVEIELKPIKQAEIRLEPLAAPFNFGEGTSAESRTGWRWQQWGWHLPAAVVGPGLEVTPIICLFIVRGLDQLPDTCIATTNS